jgi:hypothetical protein
MTFFLFHGIGQFILGGNLLSIPRIISNIKIAREEKWLPSR